MFAEMNVTNCLLDDCNCKASFKATRARSSSFCVSLLDRQMKCRGDCGVPHVAQLRPDAFRTLFCDTAKPHGMNLIAVCFRDLPSDHKQADHLMIHGHLQRHKALTKPHYNMLTDPQINQ